MSNKDIELLAESIFNTTTVMKRLEQEEDSKHEENAHPRHRLPSPIAKEGIKAIANNFGVIRHNRYGYYAHSGIDIAAVEGVELLTPARCVITAIKYYARSWGHRIDFKLLEGPYRGYKLGYAHCDKIHHDLIASYEQLKKEKKRIEILVEPGAVIAWVGSTGRSTGPHLHLMTGTNINWNGYFKEADNASVIGFVNPVDCLNLEGCRWA